MLREILASRGKILSIGLPALVSQGSLALWSVLTLLVARVLEKEQYAAFSVAKTVELFALVMGGGFVIQALLKFASEHESIRRRDIVNSAAVLAGGLTILGSVLLLAGGGLLSSFYSEIPLQGLPPVLALLVLTEGLCAVPRNNLLAAQRTRAVMWADIAGFLTRLSIVGSMLLARRLHTPHPIFLAQSVSNVVCLGILLIQGGVFVERGSSVTLSGMRAVLSYSVYTLGTSIAVYVYSWTDILMLGKLAPEDVAVYGIARSLTQFVTSLNQAANIVLIPVTSRMKTGGRASGISRRTWHGIAIVEAIQAPFVILFAVFSRQILDLLFDGRYSEGWPIVTALALLNLVKPVGSLFSSTAAGIGRPRFSLWSVLVTAFLNVLMNLILIPRLGGLGAAIATMVSVTGGSIAIVIAVSNHLRVSAGESRAPESPGGGV